MSPEKQTSNAQLKRVEGEIPEEISALDALIKELDPEVREKLKVVMARVMDSAKKRQGILDLVQDSLDQLRLDMKYLEFDLNATRIERDNYKRQLRGEEGEDATE